MVHVMKGFQRGSLMVEVMVSSLIGTLLLYGALSIMLNSRVTYLAREGLSRVEGRGRLALEILADDIRMSGYRGCVSSGSQPIVKTFDVSESWRQPELGVRGWNYVNTNLASELDIYSLTERSFNDPSWLPHTATNKGTGVDVLKHTDIIELWVGKPYVMDVNSATITNSVTRLNANTATMDGFPESSDSDQERLLLVSDCSRNLLVKADSFNHSTGIVDLDFDATNSNTAQLTSMSQPQAIMLQGIMYYLAVPSGRDRPSLYRKEIKADGTFKNAVEVLPGVLNLQFMYGENNNSEPSADLYTDAAGVSDWSKVINVRIFMLVETESEKAAQQGHDFYFFGRTYSPEHEEDKRIRREYMTTVTLRNRALGLTVIGNSTDDSDP